MYFYFLQDITPNMAGRIPRTYSRKRPQPAPHISEFDALVTEDSTHKSNQPAATKTARHIGKWGVTSFTSLRAINNGLGGWMSAALVPAMLCSDFFGSNTF